MMKTEIRIEGVSFPLFSVNALVIGSGAAALNAAVCLHDFGQRDLAVVTDRWGGGTSANSGSDKQTYYKLSVAGDRPDSVFDMARDLAAGGSMHGDIALIEAASSTRAFFHLVQLGVPFPHDRYGGFPGYKTDHDPRQRATSAGPLTSRMMFESLAAEVGRKGIQVLDRHEIIALFTAEDAGRKRIAGAIGLDLDRLDSPNLGFVLFNAKNVVLGTGGPAGIYRDSVYPEDQTGSHGLAFEIGAPGQNLTESQFGLASVKFRWNVSGSYQQVIPRYFSTEKDGGGGREFLSDHFADMEALATAIFLKGYQWPFDPSKARGGSSLVDCLVYEETVNKGRRVFLDFTSNPSGGGRLEEFSLSRLGREAREYLEKSGALFSTPFERLQKMNPAAIKIYHDHGIDLGREPLEIAVCAQHSNGGIKGDIWWESDVRGLFPVGEANGSHGVRRPGGSALNAGQTGSFRAAQLIARRRGGEPPRPEEFLRAASARITDKFRLARRIIDPAGTDPRFIAETRREIRERMTSCAAAVRDPEKVRDAVGAAWKLYRRLQTAMYVASPRDLPAAFKNLDLCLTHVLVLEAIHEYLSQGGKSRGSYLVLDPQGEKPCPELDDRWRYSLTADDAPVSRKILEIAFDPSLKAVKKWVDVRPVPKDEAWFETVWNAFVRDEIIREEETW